MKTRTLSQNLTVSAVGYGAMGLSEFYGQTDDKGSLQVLHNLIDLNVTFIDTANLYGRGHNERLIGHFLAGLDKTLATSSKSPRSAASIALLTSPMPALSITHPTILSAAVTNPLSGLALNGLISFIFTGSATKRRSKKAWSA